MVQHASLGWTILNRMCAVLTWAIFSVAMLFLRKVRNGGHKHLLLHLTIFFGLRALVAAVMLVSMATSAGSVIEDVVIAIAVVYAVWTLLYIVAVSDDIRQTIVDSELMNRMRENKNEDKEQARVFLLSQAAKSRQRADALYHAIS